MDRVRHDRPAPTTTNRAQAYGHDTDSWIVTSARGHWYEDSSHGHISALTPVSLTLTGTHPATAPLTSTTESGRAFTPPPSPRPPCPRFTPALSPAEYCRRQLLHQDFILRAFHHLTACQRHLDGQLVYLQRQHADFMRRQQRAELLGPHSPALCRQQQRAQARLTSQRRAYLRDLEKLVEMQGWLLHQFDLQSYMRAHVARYAAHGVAGDWEKQEAAASMQGGELELCRRYQDRTFS
ncbi:hypothetical protein P8C59_009289 [Phyllachora maydis]|uniref:Uncharacterized protein n=1 Tax=Phyllachora maydis TaxID=1825666 RepID=A0AAD9MJJ3_9PEZI|nr:hypothetical protein P8C59_009289 [Phyllachora maydis]